jgi:hypothetical protein
MTLFLTIFLYVFGAVALLVLLVSGLMMVMAVRTEEDDLDELRGDKRAADEDRAAANEAVRRWQARRKTQDCKTQDAREEEDAV